MTIYVKGTVDSKMANYIMESFYGMNEGNNLQIYFTTTGGDIPSMQVIIDFISNRADQISLIAVGHIYSAGLHIFIDSVCTKSIMQGCQGMVHLPRISVDTDLNGNHVEGQKDIDLWLKDKVNLRNWLKVYENILTEDEYSRVKKGEDVWLDSRRLVKLLKDDYKNKNNEKKRSN